MLDYNRNTLSFFDLSCEFLWQKKKKFCNVMPLLVLKTEASNFTPSNSELVLFFFKDLFLYCRMQQRNSSCFFPFEGKRRIFERLCRVEKILSPRSFRRALIEESFPFAMTFWKSICDFLARCYYVLNEKRFAVSLKVAQNAGKKAAEMQNTQ